MSIKTRTLTTAATAILLLSAVPLHGAAIEIVPNSLSVPLGQTAQIAVQATDVTDLYAFQFNLHFDPTLLAVLSVTEGSFLPGAGLTFFSPGLVDNTSGTISFLFGTLFTLPGASGTGVLATVLFDTLGVGSSPIFLSGVSALDFGQSDLPVSIINGSVQVVPEPNPGFYVVPEPNSGFYMAPFVLVLLARYGRRFRR